MSSFTAAPNPVDKRQPSCRWFQFSLRTFLVLMLLVSLALGWLGTAIQRGRERRNAVLAIVKLGGDVQYFEPSSFLQKNDSRRKPLGDELLLDVETVSLSFARISNADLVHLKELTQLKSLKLSITQVSDAGLVHLKRLTQIDCLYLSNTQVSDAGLVNLIGLTQLDWLDLSGTQVSDTGVRELKMVMPKLRVVY